MSNVIQFKRKTSRVRPLRATYNPTAPYVVERVDQEDGSISYYVMDYRPETYREVYHRDDDRGRDGLAKWDAENLAAALNMRVQYGLEKFPNFKEREDYDDED